MADTTYETEEERQRRLAAQQDQFSGAQATLDAIQEYGLANFYDGKDASRAFVNYTRLTQYMALMIAEQGRKLMEQNDKITELQTQIEELQRLPTGNTEILPAQIEEGND